MLADDGAALLADNDHVFLEPVALTVRTYLAQAPMLARGCDGILFWVCEQVRHSDRERLMAERSVTL